MFGIPLELITFLGSYIMSFASTSISNLMKMRAQHNENLLKLAGLTEKSTRAARKEIQDPYTKTTRRFLAIMAATVLIFFVLFLAIVDVPIAVETSRTTGGWWIFPERTVSEFQTINAFPFLNEFKLILLSVYGLYFGNNHAR